MSLIMCSGIKWIALAILISSLFGVHWVMAKDQVNTENLSKEIIQAAMIIKFTDFIQWPEASFGDINGDDNEARKSGSFTIAIAGDNAYEALFEPFTHRTFQNRPLRIISYEAASLLDMENVQILIVSQSEQNRLQTILLETDGRPILTVGDFPGFARMGGIINFFSKPNNRVGFEINRDAKVRSGLKISSHLLRLGKMVSNEPK